MIGSPGWTLPGLAKLSSFTWESSGLSFAPFAFGEPPSFRGAKLTGLVLDPLRGHNASVSPSTKGGPMAQNARARDPYLVKSVVHASRLLSAFRSSGEALPLREVASRSGLPKSMAFRILYTLERCGMVEKVGENLYRSSLRPFKQKLHRLGYAAQGTDYQFSKEVSTSL